MLTISMAGKIPIYSITLGIMVSVWFLWYQISHCLCFCEWIQESKVTIGNTYKDCQKLQYFTSGISIAAVCFQELGNSDCYPLISHIKAVIWTNTCSNMFYLHSHQEPCLPARGSRTGSGRSPALPVPRDSAPFLPPKGAPIPHSTLTYIMER